MITNFEKETYQLTLEEIACVRKVMAGLSQYTKSNPIKADTICQRWNDGGNKPKLSPPRLRKICNFIRANGHLPLIATSNGYYVSNDKKEIEKQIKSLRERCSAIERCAAGLEKYLNDTNNATLFDKTN